LRNICEFEISVSDFYRFVTIVHLYNYHNSGHCHLLVFYLRLNTNLKFCQYLTGNTLRFHYGPNRLMLFIGFWRYYINITITIVDVIHHPIFHLREREEIKFCGGWGGRDIIVLEGGVIETKFCCFVGSQAVPVILPAPYRKHIMFPLRVQRINAIYRFVTMVYYYNYHNCGHYPSSCLRRQILAPYKGTTE
jgi:hypothetical protein